MKTHAITGMLCALALAACGGDKTTVIIAGNEAAATSGPWETDMSEKVDLTEEEWRSRLTEEQYYILREKGTEHSGTGEYAYNKDKGVYHCAGCGLPLFESGTKFESHTGWPSFWEPVGDGNVTEEKDTSLGAVRTEVLCSRCGGHLGHLFPDGPEPTGLRYCINSASLKLVEKDGE